MKIGVTLRSFRYLLAIVTLGIATVLTASSPAFADGYQNYSNTAKDVTQAAYWGNGYASGLKVVNFTSVYATTARNQQLPFVHAANSGSQIKYDEEPTGYIPLWTSPGQSVGILCRKEFSGGQWWIKADYRVIYGSFNSLIIGYFPAAMTNAYEAIPSLSGIPTCGAT